MDRPVRKPIRLKNYDYSAPGAYFITICTREKRCILSSIAAPPGGGVGEGLALPAVILTGTGSLIEKQLLRLPERFPDLTLDRYVIMPNHIHLLLTIKSGAGGAGGASPCGRGKPLPYYSIKPSSRPKDTPGAAGSRTNSSL